MWAMAVAALAVTLVAASAHAQADDYPACMGESAGLGAYDRARQAVAQQMLDRAVEAFALDPATTMSQIQDPANPLYRDGDMYVFILDKSGVMVAHGATPSLVGTDIHTLIDVQGTNLGELFTDNHSAYGKWLEYWWPNPASATEEPELKATWARTHGEYQFAVGMHPGAPGGVYLDDVDGQTMRIIYNMVDSAIAAFAADRDSGVAAIQDPANPLYRDGELYVFAHSHAGRSVAHGINPEQVGSDSYSFVDKRGVNLGELILDDRSVYGKWHEYWWPNPATETDEEERKVAWVKSYGGHVFGVGAYPDAAVTQRMALSVHDKERQEAAWQMALNAAEAFRADPASAISAIQDPDNILYHDGELYVTVLDDEAVIVAHGTNPALVGADSFALNDTRGTNLGEMFAENRSPYGKWLEYWWPNPATDTSDGELKLAIMVDRGGYTFKVGMYPERGGACADDAYPEERRIAKAMVDAAIAAYADDHVAAAKAIADGSNPLYRDGEMYVVVLDMNATIVAHGASPDLVGTSNYDLVDAQGANLGEIFAEDPSAYGKWVEYWWPNPNTETSEPERKLSWAKSSSSYIFVAGFYP